MAMLPDEVTEARLRWEPYPPNSDYEWAYMPLGDRWIITVHQIAARSLNLGRFIGWRAIAITKTGEECTWASSMEERVSSEDGDRHLGLLEIICVYHQFVERYK